MFKSLLNIFKNIRQLFQESKKQAVHTCRITTIEKDKHENYIATVQIVNKSHIFKMRPEEILADDKLTDCFSQRDMRTLTYLGYLEINSPKYKILAQRLSEADSRLIFAIKERGKDQPLIKTAAELSSDENILKSLDQKDAHMIGYTSASEQMLMDKKRIQELLEQQTKNNS